MLGVAGVGNTLLSVHSLFPAHLLLFIHDWLPSLGIMVGPKNTTYAEESAEVEVLYANLDKLKILTKKIQGSLDRLETSGKVVKDAIGPIYSNTQTLQITNSNIDRVIEAIDKLRKPLDAKGKEEGIIRAG